MKIAARNIILIVVAVGIISTAFGQDDNGGRNLGGRVFAVESEFLFVSPIAGPYQVGDIIQNCYTFQEDSTPGAGLDSGVWIDALFPNPGPPIPGIWIQHTVNPTMRFTATSDGGNGLTLVMSGWVQPVFAKRNVRLTANLTVILPPFGVIVEELAKGYEVEECPYDLP
jgi:hypothetical protein